MNARPVRIMEPGDATVVVVGCGGTGGYVIGQLCRLLYGLRKRAEAEHAEPRIFGSGSVPCGTPDLLLVEGDTVSERNLLRQYFVDADVGHNKAQVLARRYSSAYGLGIQAYPNYLAPGTDLASLVPRGAIVVGCVDNAATRALLHERLSRWRDVVYLDSGNGALPPAPEGREPTRAERMEQRESGWSGQVVCGVRKDGKTILPFPGEVYPDLLEIEDAGDRLPTGIPCGEAVISNPQRHLTNIIAATVLLSYLTPILSEGTLLNCRSVFDARQGYVRSTPTIDEIEYLAA